MNVTTLSGFGTELVKLGAMIKEAPFKSKAQQRFMFAAEARGDVAKGTARRWAHETKSIKKLPERVKKAGVSIPVEAVRILKALGRKEGENLLHVAEHAIGERREKKAALTSQMLRDQLDPARPEIKAMLRKPGRGKGLAIGAGVATGAAIVALRSYLLARRKGEK